MGSYAQHMARATENEEFAKWLLSQLEQDDQTPLRWAATTSTFYAALHLIQARFAQWRPPRHPDRHRGPGGILPLVSGAPELRPIAHIYEELNDLSEQARYRFRRFTRADVERLLGHSLQDVKNHIARLQA